jgi:branched-chain amino acid transport system ATP-binding protein
MAPLLQLRQVGMMFGGLRALHAVDLTIAAGEIVGIMGANGAGKTTLFGLIAGSMRPTSGEILLDGRSIVGLTCDRICRLGIARTFQIVRPFGGLTVLENVAVACRFGMHGANREVALRVAAELLDVIGLADRAEDRASSLTLSGQKRLELARAVATGARLVLLDEVMAGLTAAEVADMLGVIRQLHKSNGLTILIIEHVMRALMHVSGRILVLHHGESIAIGAPEEIARDERVLACYLGKAG